MINKRSIHYCATVKNLLILQAIIILFLAFSCKAGPNQPVQTDKKTLFSDDSQNKIIELLMKNMQYPTEAGNNGISGRFFVILKIEKGGKINNITVNDRDKSLKVPLLSSNEVNIIDFTSSDEVNKTNRSDYVTKDLTILENEAIRVTKMLESLSLPEWQDKSMEFAISFNFQLKKN